MKTKPSKTALAYTRVSGKGQIDGDGFARQRKAIESYARRHRLKIADWFEDAGVSGTKEALDRPGLSALMDRIATNGVRTVLVERSDRLARDLIVGELILRELREYDVKVISAESGTDLTAGDGDPTSKLIRQVLGAVAEFEKTTIVFKLRAARERQRRKTGRCEGRKPYGAKPGEAPVLDRIMDLRRQGSSIGVIAKALNDDGVLSRQGKAWLPETIARIVRRA